MTAAGALLTGLCVWQNYTLNSAIPPTAVLVGINIHDSGDGSSGRGVDFAYVVRATEGSKSAMYRTYQNRETSIGFTWDNPLKNLKYKRYDGRPQKVGEILTCDTRYASEMQWVSYDEETLDVRNCVEIGVGKSSGEPILLARTVVNCPDCQDRGRMPAIFLPDIGFAITHFSDFHILTDFELLCRKT